MWIYDIQEEVCYLNNHFVTTYVITKDIQDNVDIDIKTKTSKKWLKSHIDLYIFGCPMRAHT